MAMHGKGTYVLSSLFGVLEQKQIDFIIETLVPFYYELTFNQ